MNFFNNKLFFIPNCSPPSLIVHYIKKHKMAQEHKMAFRGINNSTYKLLFCLTKDPHIVETNPEIVKKINNYTGPLDGAPLRGQVMDFLKSKSHWVKMASFTHYLIVLVNYRYEKVGDEIQLNCDETVILTRPE